MTPQYHFFVEDTTHEVFLKDYISTVFPIEANQLQFTRTKSWGGIKKQEPKILELLNSNSEIIILIDADIAYEERQKELQALLQGIQENIVTPFSPSTFLFPNNEDSGNIESLLSGIASERTLISCFEQYETCIANHHQISIKSKIFAYTEAITQGQCTKEADRDYKNAQHWNLQHKMLQPLKSFLEPFFHKN